MANSNNEELKTARAQARFVRMTPMKARRVIDLVRGRSAAEALTILRFAPQAAAEPVAKVIASAVANAENNYSMDRDTLFIQTAFVDEGPTMKRFQPRAQGRAFRIRKRTCHITVVVASVDISANTATASRARRAESSSKAAYSKGKAS